MIRGHDTKFLCKTNIFIKTPHDKSFKLPLQSGMLSTSESSGYNK